ncbi:MAG TPA: hypothetical protein VLE51_03240 [Candidatus Saccharimonadales bacterium]|nr:hypothetical protein [Candidatus Saccharimonadales bacterium]
MEGQNPKHVSHFRKKKLVAVIAVLGIVLILVVVGAWLYGQKSASPVPKNIKNAVSFPIYYPDQKKLPAGYILDTKSFANPVKNGVSYAVNYGNGQKLIFSVQPKPSDNELQSFYGNYIPLRIDIQIPNGQAEIGTYHNQTLVSLPVINGPWIIITGPQNTNQSQLKQVLSALRK